MTVLNEIRPAEVCGFRAGGWCIQPFEEFMDLFRQHNIREEYTVVPGFANLTEDQYYDFRSAELHEPYPFSTDPCIRDAEGEFLEIPISLIDQYTGPKLLQKVYSRISDKVYGSAYSRGWGASLSSLKEKPPGKDLCSIELMDHLNRKHYLNYLEKHNWIHFVSHPKLITGLHLTIFEKWLSDAAKKYHLVTYFNSDHS